MSFKDPSGLIGDSNLTQGQINKRKGQCAAVRELLRREEDYGTGGASWVSSVTFNAPPELGGTALSALNNRENGGIIVDGREFDIDWFVDSNAVSGSFSRVLGPSAYATGKTLWGAKNYLLGHSQTYYLPYQDPSEVTAATYLGKSYKEIFNENWFEEYCPCEK